MSVAREVVAVALDLLLLTIHEPDVVAEEQVQVLVAVAGQLLLDRLELEQQVVPEGADQAQPRIFLAAKFLDQQPQNREYGRLFAALFFREQRRQRLEPPGEDPRFLAEFLPMRMACQHRPQNFGNLFAARIQRPEFDAAVVRDDFERRAGRRDIPARVPPGIFISRGEVDPTVLIEVAQQMRQSLPEVRLGDCAGDFDPVGSRIAVVAHRIPLGRLFPRIADDRVQPGQDVRREVRRALQVVRRAFHGQHVRARGNHGDRLPQLLEGPERVPRPVHEERRRAKFREVRRCASAPAFSVDAAGRRAAAVRRRRPDAPPRASRVCRPPYECPPAITRPLTIRRTPSMAAWTPSRSRDAPPEAAARPVPRCETEDRTGAPDARSPRKPAPASRAKANPHSIPPHASRQSRPRSPAPAGARRRESRPL